MGAAPGFEEAKKVCKENQNDGWYRVCVTRCDAVSPDSVAAALGRSEKSSPNRGGFGLTGHERDGSPGELRVRFIWAAAVFFEHQSQVSDSPFYPRPYYEWN